MEPRGGNALIRTAWEAVGLPGVPIDGATWLDHRMPPGEQLRLTAPTIQDGNLASSSQRSEGLTTKIGFGGTLPLRWEPEGMFRYWAQFQQSGATPVILTAGQAFRHKLAPSESDLDFDRSFATRLWRDDGLPLLGLNCYVSQWQLQAAVRSVVMGSVNVVGERASFWDFPAVVLEGGAPARPVLRGLPRAPVWRQADHDVYVKVVSVAPMEIDVKVGAAQAYGSANVPVTAGQWISLTGTTAAGNDNALGEPDSPVQLWVGSTAGWSLNDEWRFKGESFTPWVPALPPIKALNEIHVTISLDLGDGLGLREFRIRGLTLQGQWAAEPDENLGGRFADAVVRTGDRQITGTIERTYLDTELVKALLAGEPFELDAVITSRVLIGTSTFPYRWRGVCPRCVANGGQPTVATAGRLVESIAFDAYPDPADATHPDDLTIYLDNNVSDLEAA